MKLSSNLRKVIVLLVLSSLSITVMNCSKSDTVDTTPSVQIVGNWKITAFLQKEGSSAEVNQYPIIVLFLPCLKDIVFTFKSDGVLTGLVPQECQSTTDDFIGKSGSAKYEVTPGKLTITDSDGTKTVQDVSFNGNLMTWTTSKTTAGIVTTTKVVLTKQ